MEQQENSPSSVYRNSAGGITAQSHVTPTAQSQSLYLQFPSGIPDGENLAAVEKACPGFAETVRKNYEANSEFSREEKRMTRLAERYDSKERLYIAFVAFFAFVALAVYSMTIGHPGTAAIILGLPLASAVSLFLGQHYFSSKKKP